jgi:DNA-binding transcriptional LysR family regulator
LQIVEAYSAVLTASVAREELDFAIVPPVTADARLHSRHVSRDRELFVTASRGPRRHLEPVSLAAAGPLHLILPTRGNARRTRLDDYLKSVGADVAAVLEMDAMMGTLELIASSDWVSILPATLCHPDIEKGPRRLHPIVDPPLSVDYVLVTPSVRTVSAAAAAFAEVLSRQIRLIGADWERRLGHQRI